MSIVKIEKNVKKADQHKRPLIHTNVKPCTVIQFCADDMAFQKIKAIKSSEFSLPVTLNCGDSIILDFGRHCVGYLSLFLDNINAIADSPCVLEFSFGEFPYEITAMDATYSGTLGNGWIQRETQSLVFLPDKMVLNRRYSFRYLKIKRIDNASKFSVAISDIFADCVSAVDISAAPKICIPDEKLRKIYDISLSTLAECEQDVFEDGPKRDRRLWIGDLRLQAMTDYVTFKNIDLVKRCIYLFASYFTTQGYVARCVFPNSPPHIGEGVFTDYSMFFVSCLLDYVKATGDKTFAEELFVVASKQIELADGLFDEVKGEMGGTFFVDWCADLDKSVASIAIYLYVLRQYCELSKILGVSCDKAQLQIHKASDALMKFYNEDKGLFETKSKQISWHSQVWAVLSGSLEKQLSKDILEKTAKVNPSYIMHTPYMMHYYIEALWSVGEEKTAMEFIKDYWGKITDFGFDCCPEIFNPDNHFDSPYNAAEINSACHAWSCTPAYWIYRYFTK